MTTSGPVSHHHDLVIKMADDNEVVLEEASTIVDMCRSIFRKRVWDVFLSLLSLFRLLYISVYF